MRGTSFFGCGQRGWAATVVIILCFGSPLVVACFADDTANARKWSTADGRFNVVATLVEQPSADAKQLALRRKDNGATIQVPVALLSQADRDYLRRLIAASGNLKAGPPSTAKKRTPELVLDTPQQLADALIAGLSQRSSKAFANCFATPGDSIDVLKARALDDDVYKAELRDANKHFAELRREAPKIFSLLRSSAAKAGIEFKAGTVVDVQIQDTSRKGIESFGNIEITFKQPKNELAMLTMDDGFRSKRGWLISDRHVKLERLAGDTNLPDTSKWDVTGGQQFAIPRTKLRLSVPGKKEPVLQSVEIATEEGKVVADVIANEYPGLQYLAMVIDYKKARGGKRSDATDEQRVEGGLAGGAAAAPNATIVEKYGAPRYATGPTAGQLMRVPGKRGMPDQHVLLFVRVRDSVLTSYQATYDARAPADVQAKIRKLLESMLR